MGNWFDLEWEEQLALKNENQKIYSVRKKSVERTEILVTAWCFYFTTNK